ncbi:hypothetical protein KEM54_002523, partial [Ascosphaera aggregata]
MPSKRKMEVIDLTEQEPQKISFTKVSAQASPSRTPHSPPTAIASPGTRTLSPHAAPRTPTTTSYT